MSNATAYFSVPADFAIATIDKNAKANVEKELRYPIREVYGALSTATFGSGRPNTVVPRCDYSMLKEYVGHCVSRDMQFNYTFNAACLSNRELTPGGRDEVLEHIQLLHTSGVSNMTISAPSVLELVGRYFPGIRTTLSVICGVDSLAKVRRLIANHSISGLYVHERLHRNLAELREICKFCTDHNVEVGAIVNVMCHVDCPYRHFHYNYVTHASADRGGPLYAYYDVQCAMQTIKEPRHLLTAPWIRPEDINMYVDLGIRKLKVAGRERVSAGADFIRAVATYNQGHYHGNLFELFACFADESRGLFTLWNDSCLAAYLTRVFAGEINCSSCDDCGYCRNICERIVHNEEVKNRHLEACERRMEDFLGLGNSRNVLMRIRSAEAVGSCSQSNGPGCENH